MPHDTDPLAPRDVVEERLGAQRSGSLTVELARHGLVIIDGEELARLRQVELRYERLATLVAGPDISFEA